MTYDTKRGRYPASMEEILRAQDRGRESLATNAPCPYMGDGEQQRFLRSQWAQGRGGARVQLRDDLGMYDITDERRDTENGE